MGDTRLGRTRVSGNAPGRASEKREKTDNREGRIGVTFSYDFMDIPLGFCIATGHDLADHHTTYESRLETTHSSRINRLEHILTNCAYHLLQRDVL